MDVVQLYAWCGPCYELSSTHCWLTPHCIWLQGQASGHAAQRRRMCPRLIDIHTTFVSTPPPVPMYACYGSCYELSSTHCWLTPHYIWLQGQATAAMQRSGDDCAPD